MTLYYVYNVKTINGERVHAFVEDPLAFAKTEFNPKCMEFSGVSVEADTPQLAQQIYVDPSISGKMCSCEEPLPTQLKKLFGSNENLDHINILTKNIVVNLIDISDKLATLSRCLNEIEPDILPQEFYAQLKQQYVAEFLRLQYRPYDG